MKKYIQASWNGVFSPTFIMKNSNITNRAEAKKLSDYLWEKGYDSGFETKEQWLRTFDFDDIYEEMKEDDKSTKPSKKSRYLAYDIDYVPSDSSDQTVKNLVTAAISSTGAYPDVVEIEHIDKDIDRLSISYSWGSDVDWPDAKHEVIRVLEDELGCEFITDYVKSSTKVEASFSRSSFDSLRGNDKEDELRAQWYDEESYPDVDPERLRAIHRIKWDGVSAEDTECILYDDIDLKPIKKIAYLNDYDMEKAYEQGFEGGYEITYKDGTVRHFAWRPYPRNLESLVDIDASTKVRKKEVNASSRFDKLNQAKKELMQYDKEKVDYVRQCQDEIMKEISRYYEESEDNDEAVGPRLSSIKSDFIEEALEDDLMTEDEFEDILSLLDQIDIYLGNPGE